MVHKQRCSVHVWKCKSANEKVNRKKKIGSKRNSIIQIQFSCELWLLLLLLLWWFFYILVRRVRLKMCALNSWKCIVCAGIECWVPRRTAVHWWANCSKAVDNEQQQHKTKKNLEGNGCECSWTQYEQTLITHSQSSISSRAFIKLPFFLFRLFFVFIFAAKTTKSSI